RGATPPALTGAAHCVRTSGESVGSYTITCDPGTLAADNYNFQTGTTANFAINKATLNVNAVANSKIYGQDDPSFSATLSGFQYSQDEAGLRTAGTLGGAASCSRDPGQDAGTYTITCAPGTLHADNYDFVTGSTAVFTINKADTSLTVDAQSSTYSEQAVNVTFTATVSNTSTDSPVNEGTVTFTIKDGVTPIASGTSGILSSGAASKTLALPAGTTVGSYTITCAPGTLHAD